MQTIIRYSLVMDFVLSYSYSYAQKLYYTAHETEISHDSINQSRWDIGGSLSQYTFRYMSEFFPVGIINKADKSYDFPVKFEKAIEAIQIQTEKDTLSFENYLKKLHLASFIVVHKGTIVYEKYFSMLPEDHHTLQSISKVVTSLLITSLINENKININLSIEHYIPYLKDSDWQGISVRDILNMRSGMDSYSIDFESGPFTNPQHKNYQFESALGILPKIEPAPDSVYKFIKELKRDKPAGIAAEYSNINTFVLGWLAETVTNQKYSDLVSERIWKPIGASSDAYIFLSDNGIAWSHGGMSATLRDLARFGTLLTQTEIQARNESLISFAQLKEIFDAPPIENFPIPFKWAYQWDFANDGIMMKGGFGGQALYVQPEMDIVIEYYNYVDKDWSNNNMISDTVLYDIIKSVE